MSIERLVHELDVSAMTIHRDLRLLDSLGEVRRVRAGAVAPQGPDDHGLVGAAQERRP